MPCGDSTWPRSSTPTPPLAANNLGNTYYKLEPYDEAARWFEKTLALDPRRAVA